MSTPPSENNRKTVLVVGTLSLVLLAGAITFIYLGFQLLGRRPAHPQVAEGPAVTATVAATPKASESPTLAATATRTPVVIIAATAIPFTPGPKGTANPEDQQGSGGSEETVSGAPAATATPGRSSRPVASPGSTGDELPQTGLGLGVPIFGLVLAGVASAAHWLRKNH